MFDVLLGPSPGGRRLRLLKETQELNSSTEIAFTAFQLMAFGQTPFTGSSCFICTKLLPSVPSE